MKLTLEFLRSLNRKELENLEVVFILKLQTATLNYLKTKILNLVQNIGRFG